MSDFKGNWNVLTEFVELPKNVQMNVKGIAIISLEAQNFFGKAKFWPRHK
jgi:hypothetical protein